LFKVQVYRLAEVLGFPQSSANGLRLRHLQRGEHAREFFFRLPFDVLDGSGRRGRKAYPASRSPADWPDREQVERVVKDLLGKQRTTEYLRLAPLVYPPVGSPDRLGTDGSTA